MSTPTNNSSKRWTEHRFYVEIKLVFLLSSLWPSNLHKLLAILSLFILDDVDQRH
jgi:hypothetical protein